MGNKSSSNENVKKIAWAMPPFCVEKFLVTAETIKLVADSWGLATSGESEPFKIAKIQDPSLTPIVFFYNTFYSFLFELVPECKHLFKKGIAAQGRMLALVLKFVVQNLNESSQGALEVNLKHLAQLHNSLGIIAEWYTVVGQVLIQTVRVCVGSELCTSEIKNAWVQVYSKLMSVIIPEVVKGTLPQDGIMGDNRYKHLLYDYKAAVIKELPEVSHVNSSQQSVECKTQHLPKIQSSLKSSLLKSHKSNSNQSSLISLKYKTINKALCVAEQLENMFTVFSGIEAVNYMMKENVVENVQQAIVIGNNLLDLGIIRNVSDNKPFANDLSTYQFTCLKAQPLVNNYNLPGQVHFK